MKEINGNNKCKGWLVLCISIMMAVVLACPAFAIEKEKDDSGSAQVKSQTKTETKASAHSETSDDTNKWQDLKEKYASKKKVKQLIFVKYKGNSEARLVLYEKIEPEKEKTDEQSPTEPSKETVKATTKAVAPTTKKPTAKPTAKPTTKPTKSTSKSSSAAKSSTPTTSVNPTDPTKPTGTNDPDEDQVKWKKVLACKAYVGQYGIGKEKEGDRKTPIGDFTLTCAFGVKKDPGSKMDYTKLNEYLYWCGDRDHYNQMIDIRKHPHSCRGEHLINYTKQYAYTMALNYNKKCVYGKGSAIFLHCFGYNRYTLGCIAVSEENMKTILKTCEDKSKICIYSK